MKKVFLNSWKNPWKINEERFTFSNTEAWKPTTLLQTSSFTMDLPRILFQVLIISRTVRTHLFYRNQNKDRREIEIKKYSIYKSQKSMFSIRFYALLLFQFVFEETSLPLKRINILFYYKKRFIFQWFLFDEFNFYFSFLICTINRRGNIGAGTSVWPQIFSHENRKRMICIFSTVNRK